MPAPSPQPAGLRAAAHLKDCDILLCKGTGPVSELIKSGTGSVYSHVAVIASARLKLLIEAIPQGGVRAISLNNFKTEFNVYRVRDPHAYHPTGVVAYLVDMLAKHYDFEGVIKFGAKIARSFALLGLWGLKATGQKEKADQLQKDQDFFCSELTYRAFYEGGGLDIVPDVPDSATVAPGDIARSKLVERVV